VLANAALMRILRNGQTRFRKRSMPSPHFLLSRSLFAQDADERASADIGQVTETGHAAPRSLDELVGNRLSAFMIATVRKLTANFVKHNVHVGLRTLVKFAQFNAPVSSPTG
jgi:hypothetical protein